MGGGGGGVGGGVFKGTGSVCSRHDFFVKYSINKIKHMKLN